MGNLLSQIKEHLDGFHEILSNEDVELYLKAKEENQCRKELLYSNEYVEKDIFCVNLKEAVEEYKKLEKPISFKVEISYFIVFSVLEILFEKYQIDDEDVGIMQGVINKTIDANMLNNYLINKYGKKDIASKLILFSVQGARLTTLSIILVAGYESAMKNELNEGILDALLMLLKELPDSVYANKSQQSQKKNGCYIATCVYGSYNCPEVWVLRRFRDFKLSKTIFGKAFIKIYYSISPKMVKLFGNKEWFKRFFKRRLDKKVDKCIKKGYSNEPYIDLY